MAIITDPDSLADSVSDDNSTEVFINTSTKKIKLNIVDSLSSDGVTLKCLYSFLKEQWRNDPNTKNLAAFSFPITPITNESFEFIDGWDFEDNTSRFLIRTAGWSVRNTSGNITQKWAGIIGLGSIESNDQLYFQQQDAGNPTNAELNGQINQAVQIYKDDDGDGNISEGSDFDKTSFFSIFCREESQLYAKSTLIDIGVSEMDSQAYRFPIATSVDLKVQEDDDVISLNVNIVSASWSSNNATYYLATSSGLSTNDYVQISGSNPSKFDTKGYINIISPLTVSISMPADPSVSYVNGGKLKSIYSFVDVNYFSNSYKRYIESTSSIREFGIIVDAGTLSGITGQISGSYFTTTLGNIPVNNNPFSGGTLNIHSGSSYGTYYIKGNPSTGSLEIYSSFPSTGSNISFTISPATKPPITAEDIYTAIQYKLRQNSNINNNSGSVIGKTADQLCYFIGDNLVAGRSAVGAVPENPIGGGSGVLIEGFSSNDTNRLSFYDNLNVQRVYPFLSTLTINFGDNLINDAAAKYWVYYTSLPGAGNDFGEAGAVIVKDRNNADMTGLINGESSIELTFDYDNNIQGGRTPGTNADITVVAIGLTTGQYVKAVGTIERSTSNIISLIAALERNYSNV